MGTPRQGPHTRGLSTCLGRATCSRENAVQTCRRSGSPPSVRRTLAGRKTTATGRSPGLRVSAGSGRLLRTECPNGIWPDGSPLTVAGAAGVLNPVPIFIPVSGEPVAGAAIPGMVGRVNSSSALHPDDQRETRVGAPQHGKSCACTITRFDAQAGVPVRSARSSASRRRPLPRCHRPCATGRASARRGAQPRRAAGADAPGPTQRSLTLARQSCRACQPRRSSSGMSDGTSG